MHDPLTDTPECALPTSLPASPATPPGRPSWSGLVQFSLVGIPLKA